jgi:hypothetical protein
MNRNVVFRYDSETYTLEVLAERDIQAGEEILADYLGGPFSNPYYFIEYGFTQPPHAELVTRFPVDKRDFEQLWMGVEYSWFSSGDVVLHSDRFASNAYTLFLSAGKKFFPGENPSIALPLFLQNFTETYIETYERDDLLKPFIARLFANLEATHRPVWWAPCDKQSEVICENQDTSTEDGDVWKTDVIRVKMSEYITLVIHRDAVRSILDGRPPPIGKAIAESATLKREITAKLASH